jgi:frataxin-like iron-binding protein CyaY
MNREDFKQLLAESLNPLVEKLNTQSDELKSLKEKQDEIIQLATPPAGNGRHYGDREPHNGGDSGRRRNIY